MIRFFVNWLAATPELAAPYTLAALGLILCERAGVLNLTAEGMMLVGAMAAIGASISLSPDPAIVLLAAMAAAALVSLIFAGLVVVLRVNQVIVGLAMVFLCAGGTDLLGSIAGWQNQPVPGLTPIDLFGLASLPIVGPILFHQSIVVYLTPVLVLLVHFVLGRTMTGLRLRAAGDAPDAVDAAGVNVPLLRIGAILAGSALMGLAGAAISVAGVKLWFPNMTGGRGWIAIALVLFARRRPWRALAGASLFGAIEALIPRVGGLGIRLPEYIVLMTPYVVTLGVMAWAGRTGEGGSDEPLALGRPFLREERL